MCKQLRARGKNDKSFVRANSCAVGGGVWVGVGLWVSPLPRCDVRPWHAWRPAMCTVRTAESRDPRPELVLALIIVYTHLRPSRRPFHRKRRFPGRFRDSWWKSPRKTRAPRCVAPVKVHQRLRKHSHEPRDEAGDPRPAHEPPQISTGTLSAFPSLSITAFPGHRCIRGCSIKNRDKFRTENRRRSLIKCLVDF